MSQTSGDLSSGRAVPAEASQGALPDCTPSECWRGMAAGSRADRAQPGKGEAAGRLVQREGPTARADYVRTPRGSEAQASRGVPPTGIELGGSKAYSQTSGGGRMGQAQS